MNNFQAWLDDADMPTKVDGFWVDLETGLQYEPDSNYTAGAPARRSLSQKALDARELAKFFGGKALSGSKKQKEWAEKIRAEKLAEMDDSMAAMACDPEGLGRLSKFWIENRSKSGVAIGKFFMEQKALLKTARSLHASGKEAEYAAAAAKYNDLTSQWGF